MMHKFVNKKEMIGSKEIAYKLIENCEEWPNFIKECLKVNIIERNDNSYLRYMESKVNGKLVSMKTCCEFFPGEYKMKFRQVKSPWPIKSNAGEWYVYQIEDGKLEMVLSHCIEAKYGCLGDFIIKLIIGKQFVHNHAELVLNEFKKKIENMS
ncbi:SRPBCC family protein [Clostridium butyricum]|jgi:ribosome-associated toxin RatA of RatAB toxin-antitoxin module|uniref:SRPBCC family protein n=1 Tax=Clostridium butyricum TaxID=1492 RepID=UPI001BA6EFED|nr:SRPBCC family protein [Clostridium butyricum]MDU1005639.1 hypothetical protein [Clostridium butyricum]QUF83679.1 hypothetical protein KDJ93_01715 [Clostridium butyricum]